MEKITLGTEFKTFLEIQFKIFLVGENLISFPFLAKNMNFGENATDNSVRWKLSVIQNLIYSFGNLQHYTL